MLVGEGLRHVDGISRVVVVLHEFPGEKLKLIMFKDYRDKTYQYKAYRGKNYWEKIYRDTSYEDK
jgi:hypothetical protein